MHELVITRHNHLIDPMLHFWEWQIPVYLFLGGLVAGMMIISGYFIFSGRTRNTQCSCFMIPLIALGGISLGMFALFLDLEHQWYVWRFYTTFQWTSPMSWGSWILLLVYPILILNAIIRIPDRFKGKFPKAESLAARITGHAMVVKMIGVMSMIVGGLLGMYTGVLLSSFGSRPAWNSSMLWILFLVSGLSSAAALIHMIAREREERELLAKSDNFFLVFELFIFMLLLIGFLSSSQVQIDAAMLFINGPFAAVFWVFVIGIGIVVPLIIQILAVNHKVNHTPVAPIMVMLGGLLLRFVIVAAGQYSAWSTAFFK